MASFPQTCSNVRCLEMTKLCPRLCLKGCLELAPELYPAEVDLGHWWVLLPSLPLHCSLSPHLNKCSTHMRSWCKCQVSSNKVPRTRWALIRHSHLSAFECLPDLHLNLNLHLCFYLPFLLLRSYPLLSTLLQINSVGIILIVPIHSRLFLLALV